MLPWLAAGVDGRKAGAWKKLPLLTSFANAVAREALSSGWNAQQGPIEIALIGAGQVIHDDFVDPHHVGSPCPLGPFAGLQFT